MWSDVSSSNKRPGLIASYYLNTVCKLKGVPNRVVGDDGTEHALIGFIHIFLRNNLNSFSIVKSTSNQRIEAYWSKLRKDKIGL